jgi:serine phosphatase RsbU (regulator of sigma subunit)
VRTQNKILFDRYLSENEEHIFSRALVMPVEEKKVVEFGKLQLQQGKLKVVNDDGVVECFEPRSFQELRRDFAKLSLYSYKEVQRAMVRIKSLCLDALKLDLFFYAGKQPVRVEEYRS